MSSARDEFPGSDAYRTHYAPLLGRSAQMRAVERRIAMVADTDATILVRGESGVGKEIVARAIHEASPRHAHPFVKVNCAALPTELLESELFGYEKGAFTGAYRRKLGKFEAALGGTILLDEIGDMPIGLQAKLLHVLQDRQFARVGGAEVITVDVRVIASTNRDLETAVRGGVFREDLYYRLKVITLHVPPLRERAEEIPALAQAFVTRFNAEYRRELSLGQESIRLLCQYAWPGNVRELENMIRRAVALQNEQLLQEELSAMTDASEPVSPVAVARPDTIRDIARRAAMDAERTMIREVLDRVQWNRAEAARVLNIGYKALPYKMDRCGLARKRPYRRQATAPPAARNGEDGMLPAVS
jgi:transcriptional regulator with GAF, ATPase, and Fis domain